MADTRDWLYLSVGPFPDAQAYLAYAEKIARETDPLHFAVVDLRHELPGGTLALMRRQPQHGVLEVGFMAFSPTLQRSRISTEAQFLLMSHLFDELGYRRYEWKCDSLNERSRNAAERLGFQYEGTFRQALVYKGRNRDTAAAGNLTRKLSIMNKIATAIRSAHLDQSGIPRPLPSTRWREAIDANVRRDRP
ncbi:N-acetyltransferase GCN5 [Cupriavidus necator]